MLTGSDFVTATGLGVFVAATVAILSREALAIFPDIVSFTVESCDPLVAVIGPSPAFKILPMASIAPLVNSTPAVAACWKNPSSELSPDPPPSGPPTDTCMCVKWPFFLQIVLYPAARN